MEIEAYSRNGTLESLVQEAKRIPSDKAIAILVAVRRRKLLSLPAQESGSSRTGGPISGKC